jgi:hypothetical protein
MKKADEDLRNEYDFSGGVRGKYAARFGKGFKCGRPRS